MWQMGRDGIGEVRGGGRIFLVGYGRLISRSVKYVSISLLIDRTRLVSVYSRGVNG